MTSTNPFLLVKEITDIYSRQNFENLQSYFQANNQLLGFKFFEKQFTQAQSNAKIAHGLGFVPKDVLVTKIVGTGNITFNHGKFDSTNIDVTVSAACTVRFFLGTYWNSGQSPSGLAGDATTYYPGISSSSSAAASASNTVTQVVLPLTNAQVSSGSYPSSSQFTYYVRSGDSLIYTSGTMGIVLPLAANYANKILKIYKSDNTFLITTISTQGQDTLVDSANQSSGSTSQQTTLNTLQENVDLFSDGTTWTVIRRDFYKGQVAYIPGATPAGFTTNVTTTALWSRQGNKMTVDFDMRFTGATNVPSGGRGQVNFPAGLTVDANRMKYPPTVSASICGFGIVITSAGVAYDFCPFMLPADTNLVNFGALQVLTVHAGTVFPNDTDVNQTQPAVVANGTGMMGQFTVPITGWKG